MGLLCSNQLGCIEKGRTTPADLCAPVLICALLTVAATMCNFHLDSSRRLSIPEQPELTLGAHIWDCAIPLAFQLHHHFDHFLSPARHSGRSLHIIELGAGCGVVGLVAALSAQERQASEPVTYLTDIEQVVGQVTLPLLARLKQSFPWLKKLSCSAHALDWAEPELPPSEVSASTAAADLLVLATDVLYNVESHNAFLQCLLHLFEQPRWANKSAWVGYKPRANGDDTFFAKAQARHLLVERCDGGADRIGVQLYRIAPDTEKQEQKR